MREYGERGMSSLIKKLKRRVKHSKREFEIARGAREKKVYHSNGGMITVGTGSMGDPGIGSLRGGFPAGTVGFF